MPNVNAGSLAERTLLVTLRIGIWTGQVHDQDITDEVAENHKADQNDAGRYIKRLMPKDWLKPVHGAAGVLRRQHKLLTLPWEDDGARIISTRGHEDYIKSMKPLRQSFDTIVEEACSAYPAAVKTSRVRLGTAYNKDEYPDVSEIKAKFWVDIETKGLPEATDFRAKMSDASSAAIVKDIERRQKERLTKALSDVFARIVVNVEKVHERLSVYKPGEGLAGPDGVFRDTLISNIRTFADTIDTLNIADDPALNDMKNRLVADICKYEPQRLRDDAKARNEVVKRSEALLKKARAYLA